MKKICKGKKCQHVRVDADFCPRCGAKTIEPAEEAAKKAIHDSEICEMYIPDHILYDPRSYE